MCINEVVLPCSSSETFRSADEGVGDGIREHGKEVEWSYSNPRLEAPTHLQHIPESCYVSFKIYRGS